jgi:hypothetical protein
MAILVFEPRMPWYKSFVDSNGLQIFAPKHKENNNIFVKAKTCRSTKLLLIYRDCKYLLTSFQHTKL